MTEQEINDLILIADGYTLEMTGQLSTEMKKGCLDCIDSARIMQITVLKSQLEYKVIIDDYGTETQSLYNCLLDAVADYSGASISLDPNASIPNTIIDVTIIGELRPAWFDFSWSEMESSDEVDGARYTYINPVLDGWNPSTQMVGGVQLVRGVNYDMYEGGILRLRDGFGIYEGSYIRLENFQPYTAPPLPPPVEDYYVANNTNQKSNLTPSIGNVTIQVVIGVNTSTIGAFSQVGPFSPQTIIIRTPVALVLVSGVVTINLLGGDVDNPINVSILPDTFIKIYNNN
jgi:hypothetical protein